MASPNAGRGSVAGGSGQPAGVRLLLLGKPGSGKGTQAKRIEADFGVPAVSTGDMIRAAIASGSELGREFRSYSEKGRLVPDALVLSLVEERLGQPDCARGYLLDGFPRTLPQAEALDARLQKNQAALGAVLYLDVPDEILIERAAGRRFCAADGTPYHVRFSPPKREGICDVCGGALAQRPDDQASVVAERISVYNEKTAPLVGFYEQRGVLVRIDGVGTPREVEARIDKVLHGS